MGTIRYSDVGILPVTCTRAVGMDGTDIPIGTHSAILELDPNYLLFRDKRYLNFTKQCNEYRVKSAKFKLTLVNDLNTTYKIQGYKITGEEDTAAVVSVAKKPL